MLPATRLRFIAAIDAAFARDAKGLRAAFDGMPDEIADKLAKHVAAGLELAARASGDWGAWAEALHHMPSPGRRAGAAELRERLDAWVAPQPRRADSPRRRLARLAVRLVREGMPGRDVLRQLDAANATLPAPLPPDSVGSVALWAARAVRGLAHVA